MCIIITVSVYSFYPYYDLKFEDFLEVKTSENTVAYICQIFVNNFIIKRCKN